MAVLNEMFGFGGYLRPVEGFLSWQHLLFVTVLNVMMAISAMVIGFRCRHRSEKARRRVLAVAAFWLDGLEVFKLIILTLRHRDPLIFLSMLPLFLCSVQLIAIPLAAFSHGRLHEAALDFVCIFGLLGAVLGTYCAGNDYGMYPVLSFDTVISGLTHCISGFASLYVLIAGMASLKKHNIGLTVGILLGFCGAAYVANLLLDNNYMFLVRGDGTPYDILYNLVGGNPVLYPLGVVMLFLLYIVLYYRVYFAVCERRCRRKEVKMA